MIDVAEPYARSNITNEDATLIRVGGIYRQYFIWKLNNLGTILWRDFVYLEVFFEMTLAEPALFSTETIAYETTDIIHICF